MSASCLLRCDDLSPSRAEEKGRLSTCGVSSAISPGSITMLVSGRRRNVTPKATKKRVAPSLHRHIAAIRMSHRSDSDINSIRSSGGGGGDAGECGFSANLRSGPSRFATWYATGGVPLHSRCPVYLGLSRRAEPAGRWPQLRRRPIAQRRL